MLIYLFVNLSSIFVIQERLDPLLAFLKRRLQCLRKVLQMTAKLSKKQSFPSFDVFGESAPNYENFDWLCVGIHTSPQRKQKGVCCVLEVFPSEMG